MLDFEGVWVRLSKSKRPHRLAVAFAEAWGCFILRLFLPQSREAVRGGSEAEPHVSVCDSGVLSPSPGGGDGERPRGGERVARRGPGSAPCPALSEVLDAGCARSKAAAVPGHLPEASSRASGANRAVSASPSWL